MARYTGQGHLDLPRPEREVATCEFLADLIESAPAAKQPGCPSDPAGAKRVRRVGNTVIVGEHELELTPQLAELLELALKRGGLPFDAARERFSWDQATESGIRARVAKLRKMLASETRRAPFVIEVTTAVKRIRARIRPRTMATKKLPAR